MHAVCRRLMYSTVVCYFYDTGASEEFVSIVANNFGIALSFNGVSCVAVACGPRCCLLEILPSSNTVNMAPDPSKRISEWHISNARMNVHMESVLIIRLLNSSDASGKPMIVRKIDEDMPSYMSLQCEKSEGLKDERYSMWN